MDILEHCVQDYVNGAVWQKNDQYVLTLSPYEIVQKASVVLQPPVVVRYAIPRIGPNHLYVVPAIFVSEKGGMLYGKQAWQFIFKNYQLYPRAEIFGLQSDGKKVQYFLRELDFADHPRVFAYENEQKIMPSFQLDGFYPSKEVQPPSLLKTLLPITAPKAP